MIVAILLCSLPLALPVLGSFVAALLPCVVLLSDLDEASYPAIYAPDPRPTIGALPAHPWGPSAGLKLATVRQPAYPVPEILDYKGGFRGAERMHYTMRPELDTPTVL